jgi:hypothetical protein
MTAAESILAAFAADANIVTDHGDEPLPPHGVATEDAAQRFAEDVADKAIGYAALCFRSITYADSIESARMTLAAEHSTCGSAQHVVALVPVDAPAQDGAQ